MERLIVKRGRKRVHAARPDGNASLCGIAADRLQEGSRHYHWPGQVGCRNCQRSLWALGEKHKETHDGQES